MFLVRKIYELTKKVPQEEQYGLISQVCRAAVSIPSNIAEGSKRGKKEFAQFLRVAMGSAAELETQLLLVEELYHVQTKGEQDILVEVQKMLESLIRKL